MALSNETTPKLTSGYPTLEQLADPNYTGPRLPAPVLGHAESTELQLPEADYGAEVKAMVAVLAQFRSLIGNLEGLLFNLQVYSHRAPDLPKPDKLIVMDKGDFVEHQPHRLVKGFGICNPKEIPADVHTTANEQETTTPGS